VGRDPDTIVGVRQGRAPWESCALPLLLHLDEAEAKDSDCTAKHRSDTSEDFPLGKWWGSESGVHMGVGSFQLQLPEETCTLEVGGHWTRNNLKALPFSPSRVTCTHSWCRESFRESEITQGSLVLGY
jgi:hypothetical protein